MLYNNKKLQRNKTTLFHLSVKSPWQSCNLAFYYVEFLPHPTSIMIPLSLRKKWKFSPHPLQRWRKALVNTGEQELSYLDLPNSWKCPPFFCKGKWGEGNCPKGNFYGVGVIFRFQFKELWTHYIQPQFPLAILSLYWNCRFFLDHHIPRRK